MATFFAVRSRRPDLAQSRSLCPLEWSRPLGQGVATSVGMAIAGRWMAEYFNRPNFEMFNYDTYAMCGDGCMMEGISNEAASVAGHLKLSNLCWIYDNNHITIEGNAALAFSDDVATRFIAYGWNVTRVGDANDLDMLTRAFQTFKATPDRPTLIIVDSHIGYGAPHKQDTSAAHGEPLGEEEVRLTKQRYGWPPDASFLVPDGVREHFQAEIGKRGAELRGAWYHLFDAYKQRYPELADHLNRMQRRQLPDGWDRDLPTFEPDPKGVASRESSGKVLNAIAKNIPWLIGGSADLAPSTKTRLTFEGSGDFQAENYAGRNLHFGVREHAMSALLNGMALSKIRPFGSGFFGLIVMRPADANEVAQAWRVIIQLQHEPVVMVLSRQALPTFDRTRYGSASGVARGAYVMADAVDGKPDVLLLATGSEVSLCIAAYEQLKAEGMNARVVSMPSWELFEHQSQEYRESVIPPDVRARVAVEEASTLGWAQYVGLDGTVIGMHTFGQSAPLQIVQRYFKFTPEHVVAVAKEQIARTQGSVPH